MMRLQLDSLGDLWIEEFTQVSSAALQLIAIGCQAGLVLESRAAAEDQQRLQFSMRRAHDGLQVFVSLTGELSADSPTPLRAGMRRYRVQCARIEDSESAASAEEFVAQLKVQVCRFSAGDLRRIARLNPLVRSVADSYGSIDLGATGVVLCDHPLLEKLNMARALVDMGVSPDRFIVVVKRDRTQYRDQVCAEIQRLGVRVIRADQTDEIVRATVAMKCEQLVVLDDGGSIIRALANVDCLAGVWKAPIETTTKGIRLLRRELPELELLDLASCSTKRELAREIAVSCVLRFRALLQHEKVSGERCVVIGYGQLGCHIADLLTVLGSTVSVVDVEPSRRAAAFARGYRTSESLNSVLRAAPHRFLFGCSGVPSVTINDLNLMLPNRVLVTVSSQDLVFVQEALSAHATHEECLGLGDVYVDDGGCRTAILGHGDAVNLYLSEGVSEPEFDPFTALLIIAVAEVGCRASAHPPMRSFDVEGWCRRVEALRFGPERGRSGLREPPLETDMTIDR